MQKVQEMIDDILCRAGGYGAPPADQGRPTKDGITQKEKE